MIAAIALAAVTSTASPQLDGIALDLYRALSRTVARAETAEAALAASEQRAAVEIAAAARAAARERAARKDCEARPAEVPGWVWPVVGIAAGVAGAGVVVLVAR